VRHTVRIGGKNTYMRDTLIKASDSPYSEYKYLREIFKDAILRG